MEFGEQFTRCIGFYMFISDGLNLVYSESDNISYGSITECRQALDRYFSFTLDMKDNLEWEIGINHGMNGNGRNGVLEWKNNGMKNGMDGTEEIVEGLIYG